MSSIVFEPYVGASYRSGRSPVRLVVVGESHYGTLEGSTSAFTTSVVEDWQTGRCRHRYFTTLARILTGLEARHIDRSQTLHDIAFYNFIQVILPEKESRPTLEQARASQPAFREMLDRLDPTHTLVTGDLVWNNLPTHDAEDGGTPLLRRRYRTPSGMTHTARLPHLTRASAPEWQAPVAAFLACAR